MSEATKAPAYSPGLEGVIAGESAIAYVDSNAGLTYRGYDVHDLAGRIPYEQAVYLLLHGEMPSADQLRAFRAALASERGIPNEVTSMLRLLPRGMHPMDALRTGLSMLGGFDPEVMDLSHDANIRKSIRIIAKLPTIVTSGWRIAHGQEPIAPRPEHSHAANFLYLLTGKEPEKYASDALDVMMLLYAEHDFNASTFAARVTVSTLSDIYSGVTSAIGALKGALHGGANEETLTLMEEVKDLSKVEGWIREKLAKKQKIMGFGHRIYKTGDSRVPTMRDLCRDLSTRFNQPQWITVGEALESVMAREKNLFANADLYAAPIFHMLGIPTALNTPIFACARAVGWCAHITEQQDHNRIIRPKSLYNGHPPRKWNG
jgi:2-methylcitrate synthase/citrate synthase II